MLISIENSENFEPYSQTMAGSAGSRRKDVTKDDNRDINSDFSHTEALAMINSTIEKLCETFNKTLATMMDLIESKLNVKVDSQGVEIFDLNVKVEKLEKTNVTLVKENDELRRMIKDLNLQNDERKTSFDVIEQSLRRNNVVIHGVPEEQDDDRPRLEAKVLQLVNSNLGITLQESDIADIHRMPKPSDGQIISKNPNQAESKPPKPPAILLELKTRKTRNVIMEKRKLLKGKSISISEHLAPARSQLLMKANTLVSNKKLQSAWSSDGKILVKPNQSNRVITVKNITDLDKYA